MMASEFLDGTCLPIFEGCVCVKTKVVFGRPKNIRRHKNQTFSYVPSHQ